MLPAKRRKRRYEADEVSCSEANLSGLRILDVGILQAALEAAQRRCGHSQLVLRQLGGAGGKPRSLRCTFILVCQVCSKELKFENSHPVDGDFYANVAFSSLLPSHTFQTLVDFFCLEENCSDGGVDSNGDSLVKPKEEDIDFYIKSEPKDDTDDDIHVNKDDIDPINDDIEPNKDDLDPLNMEPDCRLDELEEAEIEATNPNEDVDYPVKQELEDEAEFTNNEETVGEEYIAVMGGKVLRWPPHIPIVESPSLFIRTTTSKYGLPTGVYKYVRANGIKSVLLVRADSGSYEEVLQYYVLVQSEASSRTVQQREKRSPPPDSLVQSWRRELSTSGCVVCSSCRTGYLRVDGLRNHWKRCRGVSPAYFTNCDHCNVKFSTYSIYQTHVRKSHPEVLLGNGKLEKGGEEKDVAEEGNSDEISEDERRSPADRITSAPFARGQRSRNKQERRKTDRLLDTSNSGGGGGRGSGSGGRVCVGGSGGRVRVGGGTVCGGRSGRTVGKGVGTAGKGENPNIFEVKQQIPRDKPSLLLSQIAATKRTALSVFGSLYSERLKKDSPHLNHRSINEQVIHTWSIMDDTQKAVFRNAAINPNVYKELCSPSTATSILEELKAQIFST